MKRLLTLLLLFVPSVLSAQVTVRADRLVLNAGPCIARSGSGSPESAVTGNLCDTWLRTDNGSFYLKVSGTATNTGWMLFSTTISTPLSSNLTLAPTGDIVVAPTGNDLLPGSPYTVNIGALNNKYLTLHAAELWVETLVAQQTIATIGGRVLVAPTNILTSDLVASLPANTIAVKYNNLNNGDRIYLESSGKVEFMSVNSAASGSGPYAYAVTRDLDGSGPNVWFSGDAILDTGTTGNGFIDLYSVAGILSGAGPTIVGNVRTGTAYNAYAPRWAIGNLNGLYGYASSIYGSAFGDAANTNVTVDATNGFRVRSGTTDKFAADTSGNLAMTGNLTIGTNGTLHSAGATAFGTGTGFFMSGGATPTFRIGVPGGQVLQWDGTTLAIAGTGTGLTSINGGNIITGTITSQQIASNSIIVGDLNATGLSDNIVKNGTFEGGSVADALSGWIQDDNNAPVASFPNAFNVACCGLSGPGTMQLDPGATRYTTASYQATPVRPGDKYRFFASIYATTASTIAMNIAIWESASTGSVLHVTQTGQGWTDFSSYTLLCSNCAVSVGWNTVSYTYTVPAGIYWISPAIFNTSGTSGATYTALFVDDVQMQRQIGSGHILANSITTGNIAAGAITATQIAGGTITATQIAAGSITADRLNVTSLSAITADLGNITAGNINIGSGAFTVSTLGALHVTNAADILNIRTNAIEILNPGLWLLQIDALAGGGNRTLCVDNSGIVHATGAGC